MAKINEAKQMYSKMSFKERKAFLAWILGTKNTASEPITARTLYDVLSASVKTLTTSGQARFEAIMECPESRRKLESCLEVVKDKFLHNVPEQEHDGYIKAAAYAATGPLIAANHKITVLNLCTVFCRHHAIVKKEADLAFFN